MTENPKVMVSSTARDLPEHRKEVLAACLRQGMQPTMMEHLPASSAEAVSASLRMVDEADIYVGVLAHRYGYVPRENNPRQISVTEMEYERAVERQIPRLIFLMDKEHPITIDDVEQGEGALKLRAFKERLQTENIVNFYKSPVDLRAHVINSLSQLRRPDPRTFQHVGIIPAPPDPYFAHRYTHEQTFGLVGREVEIKELTDWLAHPRGGRVCTVFGLSGTGKSALTWKWFNEVAPHTAELAGRMWWDFRRDASFENFMTHALAYVTGRELSELRGASYTERETLLIDALDRRRFLLVLDGLERIMVGRGRLKAAHLQDEGLGEPAPEVVVDAYRLPGGEVQLSVDARRARKMVETRTGVFLRRLVREVRESRTLITSQFYPADLEGESPFGEDRWPMDGSAARPLGGLSREEAVKLWHAHGVAGTREDLLALFETTGYTPQMINALARDFAHYRPARQNFQKWLASRAHLLIRQSDERFSLLTEGTLQALDAPARELLYTVAAMRRPASYDTLVDLFVGEGGPYADDTSLVGDLVELERRGLLGWDPDANTYDTEPPVAAAIRRAADESVRAKIYGALHDYFEARLPEEGQRVESIADLAAAIELYNAKVALRRYDEAAELFWAHLSAETLYHLHTPRLRIRLLKTLFDDGAELPCLSSPLAQAVILNALAVSNVAIGHPGVAVPLFEQHNAMNEADGSEPARENLCRGLGNLSNALRLTGRLRESEACARRAVLSAREARRGHAAAEGVGLIREAVSLGYLAICLATQGRADEAEAAFRRELRIFGMLRRSLPRKYEENAGASIESLARSLYTRLLIWQDRLSEADEQAERAQRLAGKRGNRRDVVLAARVRGAVALALDNDQLAEQRLSEALTDARVYGVVVEEVQALIESAELRRRRGDLGGALSFLGQASDLIEAGPYTLFYVNARNVLAHVERNAGRHEAAARAAREAYEKAWCDGRADGHSYAYLHGLREAEEHLTALGVSEPKLPPFDETKFQPMPEVEVDPPDEFSARGEWAGEG